MGVAGTDLGETRLNTSEQERERLCETRSSLKLGSLLCQMEASLSHKHSGSVLGWPR